MNIGGMLGEKEEPEFLVVLAGSVQLPGAPKWLKESTGAEVHFVQTITGGEVAKCCFPWGVSMENGLINLHGTQQEQGTVVFITSQQRKLKIRRSLKEWWEEGGVAVFYWERARKDGQDIILLNPKNILPSSVRSYFGLPVLVEVRKIP